MAVPKIESEGRACGQMLLGAASAGPRGLQPVAVAQNTADALELLLPRAAWKGQEKTTSCCHHPAIAQDKRGTWGLQHCISELGSKVHKAQRVQQRLN